MHFIENRKTFLISSVWQVVTLILRTVNRTPLWICHSLCSSLLWFITADREFWLKWTKFSWYNLEGITHIQQSIQLWCSLFSWAINLLYFVYFDKSTGEMCMFWLWKVIWVFTEYIQMIKKNGFLSDIDLQPFIGVYMTIQ